MSKQYISKALRQRVAELSNYRCGYCLTSQHIVGPYLEIDHIIPESKGGVAEEANLILACPMCNGYKSDHTQAVDPITQNVVALFNPRTDDWHTHFEWREQGAIINGRTQTGRATVEMLNVNHPDVVAVRQLWVQVGWHPPAK